MKRRFLTSEDVRREGGAEILVDSTTVVTPHALEAAESAGIVIRTDAGTWNETTQDSGPDASHDSERRTRLSESNESPLASNSAIVTAVGKNRSGVLAELTAAIAHMGANVHDVSQKVVGGYFHMILMVELDGVSSFSEFNTTLERIGSQNDFAVRVMSERVFRSMPKP